MANWWEDKSLYSVERATAPAESSRPWWEDEALYAPASDDNAGILSHLGGLWDRNSGALVEATGGLMQAAGELPRDALNYVQDAAGALGGVGSMANPYGPMNTLDQVATASDARHAALESDPNALTRVGRDVASTGEAISFSGQQASQVRRPSSIFDEPLQAAGYYANEAAGSAVPLAIAISAPEVGLPLFGAQAFGGEYDKRRGEGVDPFQSAGSATLHAAAEVIPESAALKVLTGKLSAPIRDVLGKHVASAITTNPLVRAGAGAIAEGGSEVATQIAQDATDIGMGDDISLGQMGERAKDAFMTGAVLGGPLAGAHATLQSLAAQNDPEARIRRLADEVIGSAPERIETPETQAVDAGRDAARAIFAEANISNDTGAVIPDPRAIDFSQQADLETGIAPVGVAPESMGDLDQQLAGLAPAPVAQQASAPIDREALLADLAEPELIRGGSRVFYRGDVTSMRARLAEAGLSEGMRKTGENGEDAGLYFPAKMQAQVDAVLRPNIDATADSAQETAAPEPTQPGVMYSRQESNVAALQKQLASIEAKFEPLRKRNVYDGPEWDSVANGAKNVRKQLYDLTGDWYGRPKVKVVKPDQERLDAEYASPYEVPDDVRQWVQKNAGTLTSDGTDAVRWGRIADTLNDERLPEGSTEVFRAVAEGDEIRPGDWVTTDRAYAEDHLRRYLNGKGRVISETVDGRDVLASPTGNFEESIFAPRQFSGPVKSRVLKSKRPDAKGIESEELTGDDAAEAERYIADLRKQQQAKLDEAADPLTEGFKALGKNPDTFRTQLLPGKTVRELAKQSGANYAGQSNEDGIAVHSVAVEQGAAGPAMAKIYDDGNDVWIDVSGLKSGGGKGDSVYNMAYSYARNNGRNFKEDPAGVSDTAMYRRPVQQLSALLKSGNADNIAPGDFLATQRPGGPNTRPIKAPANRAFDPTLRENILTTYTNALNAVPEIGEIRYDTNRAAFVDASGKPVTDADFDRLASNRRANPIREAMVRVGDPETGQRLEPAPVGGNSLKVAVLAQTLLGASPSQRPALLDGLRKIAAGSLGDSGLSRILPSKRTTGSSPFAGMTRDEFLGKPTVTRDSNASDLKPSALVSVRDAEPVAFPSRSGNYSARYSEDGAAVYDGDKVIASYNFGDTLVVAKQHRREGLGTELVYQWRTRYPAPSTARARTKAAQAVQERVWDRIQRADPQTDDATNPSILKSASEKASKPAAKESPDQVTAKKARPEELIEARKRRGNLRQLLDCLSA